MNVIDLNEKTWERLNARRGQLPHALLICGQRGIGKFELANRFAESLLCEKPRSGHLACGDCPACHWLAQGNHPDFRLLQPEALGEEKGGEADGKKSGEGDEGGRKKPSQQITIDQVRGLDEFLHVGTHRDGQRVVLIHPAEAMNRATANSLLKSLEEPVANTLFLLISNEPDRLLPTIRSRCQALPVPLPAAELAAAWLHKEGVGDAARWLALAGGSPLLARELGGGEERAVVDALLGQLSLGATLDALAAATAVDRVLKGEKGALPLKRLLEWSLKWLTDLALARENLPARYFVTEAAVLRKLAAATSLEKLLAFNGKALQYKAQAEQPLNSRLFLEDFFLGYAALFHDN